MLPYRALRSIVPAVHVTLVLAGTLLLVPTVARAQHRYAQKPVPHGLAAVIKNDPAAPLDVTLFSNRYISGVAIQIHWSDIEPAEGMFNWARLDELFAGAQASDKWVHLLIFPGFFSPPWALQGAETDTFKVQYGPYAGQSKLLPMPWDPVYLGNWFAFLTRVSARYGDRPEFLMIGADGPTSASDESTEPNSYPTEIQKWLLHHYTSTKYLQAWQRTFETYARTFPNQYISLSAEGAGVQINAERFYDPQAPMLLTKPELVAEAWSNLGSRFSLQSSSLTGYDQKATEASVHELVISYNGRTVTGFQLASPCVQVPTKMGAAGNPPLALMRTITNGMRLNDLGKHVDYIEIYSPDVEAEQMQPVLRWGASLLQ